MQINLFIKYMPRYSLTNFASLNSIPTDIVNIIVGFADVSKIYGRFMKTLSKKYHFNKIWSITVVNGGNSCSCDGDDDDDDISRSCFDSHVHQNGVILSSQSTGDIHYFQNNSLTYIAHLSNPCQVTVANSVVYIADWLSHVIRLYTLTGVFIRNIGENHLSFPCGVAVSSFSGEIYVSAFGNRRITVFSHTGEILRQWGQFGHEVGEFHFPKHVVFHQNKLYVVDFYNNRIQVFLPNGEFQFAFGEIGNGPSQFSRPMCLVISAFNEILVADKENKRIQIFDEHGVFLRCLSMTTKPVCITINRHGHLLVNSYKNIFMYQ